MQKRIILILIFALLLMEINTVRAQELPDFIVSDITWSPVNPDVGSSVTFTVTIKNQGITNASGSQVYYYIDDSINMVEFDYVDSIPAGGSTSTTFSWRALAGSHSIKAVADAPNRVTESDETNNEKTVSFMVNPPDLIISDITWSPVNPAVGSSVTFTVNMKNQGITNALASQVYYYIDDSGIMVDFDYVDSIPAGGSTTATFQWDAQSGSHSVKAVADAPYLISESDETNNEKTLSFQISSTPTPIYTNPPTSTPTISSSPTLIDKNNPSSKAGESGKPSGQLPNNASVSLTGEKTDVMLDEEILLKLSAVNLITKPKMHVQVIIIPPSGMSVTSSEFSKSGTNQFTANYELEPGDGKDIEVRIKPNQIGEFNVNGRIIYYFGDEKENAEDHTLPLPIKVRKEIASMQDTAQNPIMTPLEKSIPGFGVIIGISGLLFATILKRRW